MGVKDNQAIFGADNHALDVSGSSISKKSVCVRSVHDQITILINLDIFYDDFLREHIVSSAAATSV